MRHWTASIPLGFGPERMTKRLPAAGFSRASCYGRTRVQRSAREPFGGILVIAATLALVGCEIVSLDGLTGGDGGGSAQPQPWPASDASADAPADDGTAKPPTPEAGGDAGADAGPEAGPDAAQVTCGDGGVLCDGACVDPTSDPGNCNGCGNVCPTGLCGASLTESLSTMPAAWTFNGSATYNPFAQSAELTPIGNYLAGSFVYGTPIVVDAFDARFEFRMGLQGGTRSDGIGFMIEKTGAIAVGGTGGGLGMTGLSGYGVELDLHDNGVCGDSSEDHVGVDDLALCSSAEGTPTSLFASGDLSAVVDLGDAHWHSARVTLAQGAVSVSIDGTAVATGVALPQLQVGTPYYFGFAGATGGLFAADGGPGGFRQEVRNVSITFPTPRCL